MKKVWMLIAGVLLGAAVMHGSRVVKIRIENDPPAPPVAHAPVLPTIPKQSRFIAEAPCELPATVLQFEPAPRTRPDSGIVRTGGQSPIPPTVIPSLIVGGQAEKPAPKGSIVGIQDSIELATNIKPFWPIKNQDVYLLSNEFVVQIKEPQNAPTLLISSPGGDIFQLVDANPTANTRIKVKGGVQPGTYRATLTYKEKDPSDAMKETKETVETITIHVPESAPRLEIQSAANGRYATPIEASKLDKAGAFNVYSGFLSIKGANASAGIRREYLLFQIEAGATLATANFVDQNVLAADRLTAGAWESIGSIRGLAAGSRYALVVIENSGPTHSFAATPIVFTARDLPKDVAPPTITAVKNDSGQTTARTLDSGAFAVKVLTPLIAGKAKLPADSQLVILGGTESPRDVKSVTAAEQSATDWTSSITLKGERGNELRAAIAVGADILPGTYSNAVRVEARQQGPRVLSVTPQDLSQLPAGQNIVQVSFFDNDNHPLDKESVEKEKTFVLSGGAVTSEPKAVYHADTNRISLDLGASLDAGVYDLTISSSILDRFGNTLNENVPGVSRVVKFRILKPAGETPPSISTGITNQSAPPTIYPEYTPPRKVPEGFNPADKVEARVARLFYNRDAHRVAQIINRDVKSYNAVSVAVRRRLADQSRDLANKAEDDRQKQERAAVLAAQQSRALEAQLKQLQENQLTVRDQEVAARAALDQSNRRLNTERLGDNNAARLRELQADVDVVSANLNRTVETANVLKQQIDTLTGQVTAARDAEARANEAVQTKTAEERRLREEQFRREVAAAREDPDTHAVGDPRSEDPVKQVAISVVGEGLIQLRGPMKGINIVRMMINQLDAPVGQVRIGIHTVQVNGERGDRMEKVVADIQKYIDQSRFLTTQSAEELRKAIVRVAARKATEIGNLGEMQSDRDMRYLHAFFGRDFVAELQTIDSEFLHTGNKLLSLHSMDSTSLSAALMLMALAKNTVRNEILFEFQRAVQGDLAQAELNYLMSGSVSMCSKCKKGKPCKDCYTSLAVNAKFQSLSGFFNVEIPGDDTLTPIQREFIRLAQIYKARLITELELKQRVMERSLVEERLGQNEGTNQYIEARRKAKEEENKAIRDWKAAQKALIEAQGMLTDAIAEFDAALRQKEDLSKLLNGLVATVRQDVLARSAITQDDVEFEIRARNQTAIAKLLKGNRNDPKRKFFIKSNALTRNIDESVGQLLNSFQFVGDESKYVADVKAIGGKLLEGKEISIEELETLDKSYGAMLGIVQKRFRDVGMQLNKALTLMSSEGSGASIEAVLQPIQEARRLALNRAKGAEAELFQRLFAKMGDATIVLVKARTQELVSRQIAQFSRSPLDHKKFLDLLIDDVEDKYIEQLEGSRAHCANIDNYLKRIATALDDDFNRQFYQPAFRCVRDASRSWDVSLGQVESTTILTNNRAFAKVSPAASFEFDLPKRDIVLVEAMRGAKAMMDDYGALLNDPTFLALVKMRSGQPPSATVGNLLSGSPVRNILPGLPSTSDELIMAQGGSGRREFNSQLEALIPDPAIYKIETGTGFEIRPVLSPDGQSVVFNFDYMYTTRLREPVRPDEKHLGKVDRHFVHTDVQLSNYELREVSKYNVGLKVSRTSRGVQLLQDIPGLGALFRPAPSQGSSLQQNIILASATIFPTMFDLTGLRYAPAIADLDPLRERVSEFIYRNREEYLKQQVTDRSAQSVDEAMRIPIGERRPDLYRPQRTLPYQHPDGYQGPGLNRSDVPLREGYSPNQAYPPTPFTPGKLSEGTIEPHGRPLPMLPAIPTGPSYLPAPMAIPSTRSSHELLPPALLNNTPADRLPFGTIVTPTNRVPAPTPNPRAPIQSGLPAPSSPNYPPAPYENPTSGPRLP